MLFLLFFNVYSELLLEELIKSLKVRVEFYLFFDVIFFIAIFLFCRDYVAIVVPHFATHEVPEFVFCSGLYFSNFKVAESVLTVIFCVLFVFYFVFHLQ